MTRQKSVNKASQDESVLTDATAQTSLRKPLLAVVGTYQQGKSTLVNCLLDGTYAPTGKGLATTKTLTYFHFGEAEEVRLKRGNGKIEFLERREDIFNYAKMKALDLAESDRIEITCWKPLLEEIDILDTPGFNADERDDRIALMGVKEADLLVVVVANKDLNQPELRLLDEIVRRRKRYAVLVNCLEKTDLAANPEDDQITDICASVAAQLVSKGHQPIAIGGQQAVWPVNLLWAWHALGHLRREADTSPQMLMNTLINILPPSHRAQLTVMLESCDQETLKVMQSNEALKKMSWIEKHFRINREEPVPQSRSLLARSKFLPIREMLESYPWQSLASGLNEGESLLKRAVDLWDSELRNALNRESTTKGKSS